MRYQLVLQFPTSNDISDFDKLVELEDRLVEQFGEELAEVDGHDFGSGEMNIFIHTDNPKEMFAAIKGTVANFGWLPKLAAAYREMTGEEYQRLWPEDATQPFDLT
jgi:hypothetical protein